MNSPTVIKADEYTGVACIFFFWRCAQRCKSRSGPSGSQKMFHNTRTCHFNETAESVISFYVKTWHLLLNDHGK